MTEGPTLKVLQECGFKDAKEFEERGARSVSILRETDALKGGVLLEIGCAGHVAVALAPHIGAAHYHGLGLSGAMLKWCTDVLPGKSFSFHRLDVRDAKRNPSGAVLPEKVRLPFEDGSIDIVYAEGLFTTMPQEGIRRYITEIARVLKAGGRFVGSFFLLDGGTMARISQRRARYTFAQRVDTYCAAQDKKQAGGPLAYNASFIQMLGAPVHLEVKEVRWGSWSGLEAPGFEDLVIAEKLKVEEEPAAEGTTSTAAPAAPSTGTTTLDPAPSLPPGAAQQPSQDVNAAT